MTTVERSRELSDEEVIEAIRNHETAMESLWESYPSLLAEYPDQWIIWDGESVVYVSDSPGDLVRHIQDGDVDASNMVIEHLQTEPMVMIL